MKQPTKQTNQGRAFEAWRTGQISHETFLRMAQLESEHPGATIVPPGPVKAIDGNTYWNPEFIIAK